MKRLRKWIAAMLAAAITAIPAATAMAAGQPAVNPNMVTLRTNRTYTAYDVTGDGKADKVVLKSAYCNYYDTGKRGYLRIYVNGKNAFNFKDPYYKGDATWQYEVKLCTLNGSDAFFFIRTESETEYFNYCKLLRYRGGKLKAVLDLKNTYKDIFHHRECMDVKSVSGSRIQLQWYGQLGASGGLNWTVTYELRGTEFYRPGKTCPVAGRNKGQTWTASKNFTVYKSASLKAKMFNVRKGDKLKITHVYNNSKYAFLRLVNKNGKAGWIPCPNAHSEYFKEALYAG